MTMKLPSMQHDPWADIAPGSSLADLAARRVDPHHPWDLFWARDMSGRAMFVFRHRELPTAPVQLPAMNGLEVFHLAALPDGRSALLISVVDDRDRDIFLHLSMDIVAVTRDIEVEARALDAAVARLEDWQDMLSRRNNGMLLHVEQGLIGELLLLEQIMVRTSVSAALTAWKGPLGGAQDFLLPTILLEAKSRQPGRPYVGITSEHQLSVPSGLRLVLVVIDLVACSEDTGGAFRLADAVSRIMAKICATDPARSIQMSGLLNAAGCRDLGAGSGRWWSFVGMAAWEVLDGFPALVGPAMPPGISNVRYRLDLEVCDSFRVSLPSILDTLRGDTA